MRRLNRALQMAVMSGAPYWQRIKNILGAPSVLAYYPLDDTAGQTSDGVHPTQAGHTAIANQALARL